MLKTAALRVGMVFILVGILGFIPGVATYAPDIQHARLFDVFAVDILHDTLHVITGAVGVWMGLTGEYPARNFFRVAGIVYAVLAVLGFGYGDAPLFGMANNVADAALNSLLSLALLFLGFGRIAGR